MEETESGHSNELNEAYKRDGLNVELRAPVFEYLATNLVPIYQQELKELWQERSAAKLKEFHEGAFGKLMRQILDTVAVQKQEELPKVTLNLTDEEMHVIKEKVPVPFDAADRMTQMEIIRELTDQYRKAKFDKGFREFTSKIKSKFKK